MLDIKPCKCGAKPETEIWFTGEIKMIVATIRCGRCGENMHTSVSTAGDDSLTFEHVESAMKIVTEKWNERKGV